MEAYSVKIIQRDGMGQTSDDYHATVTRSSDGMQLIFMSAWRWLLKWKTRRSALDRAFRYQDKRDRKLAETDTFTR